MPRRLLGFAAAVTLAIFLAACDEAPPSAPQDTPSFAKAAPPFACLFTGNPSLSNAANTYFTTVADRKIASDSIAAMQAAFTSPPSGTTKYDAAAASGGFGLLALTGRVSRQGTGSSSVDGEALVRQAVQCMFDVAGNIGTLASPGDFFGWPDDDQFNFQEALTPSEGGTFYVRGAASDTASVPASNPGSFTKFNYPVVAYESSPGLPNVADGNLAGIAPVAGHTWAVKTVAEPTGILSNRVVIYGEKITGGYDWKLLPRGTTFTPSATVALCPALNGGQAFNDTSMVMQESVGVIGFVDGAGICGNPPSLATLQGGTGAFALLHQVGRLADRLFQVEPLSATAVALRTIGGSASGAKSDKFTALVLPTVNLRFDDQPTTVKVNQRFSVTVNVSTPSGLPAGGITVKLAAINNNGTGTGIFEIAPGAPATIKCDPTTADGQYLSAPQETTLGTVGVGGASQATNAIWTITGTTTKTLCFSKTGGAIIVATSFAAGNPSAAAGTKSSAKINVKP